MLERKLQKGTGNLPGRRRRLRLLWAPGLRSSRGVRSCGLAPAWLPRRARTAEPRRLVARAVLRRDSWPLPSRAPIRSCLGGSLERERRGRREEEGRPLWNMKQHD